MAFVNVDPGGVPPLICYFPLWSDQDFSNLPLNILGDRSQEPPLPSWLSIPHHGVGWRFLPSLVPGPLPLLPPSWEP